MGIPDHLTCLLRNPYAGQEGSFLTLYGTLIGSRLERSMTRLSAVTHLFNLYAEHIMRNARLYELQAGIKIVRGNTNNLRYADDTTLMAESKRN